MKTSFKALLGGLLFASCSLLHAQSYPDKPVRFIVPFAPGGPTDIIARLLSQKLSEVWKQPVLVENRPGAGGNVGSAQVVKALPDGYTVLINTSSMAVNATLYANPGFDLEKDLLAVTNVASSPNIIVAGSTLGAKNLKEAIEKAKTGQLNFGSAGTGTTPHLSAEYLFKVLAKVDVTHAPYKGAGPALNGALTGEVQFASVAMPAAVPLLKAGPASSATAPCPMCPPWLNQAFRALKTTPGWACFYPRGRLWPSRKKSMPMSRPCCNKPISKRDWRALALNPWVARWTALPNTSKQNTSSGPRWFVKRAPNPSDRPKP